MNWFQRFCRNVGLMVHHVRRPDESERTVLRKEVETEHRSGVTLRRTTIEEIELTPDRTEKRKETDR